MKLGFGTWRFFLAFLVVISHLWENMLPGPAAYAVWGFFLLSGFLMTHVLRHKYGPTIDGLRDYAYNRFLRIFPIYWIACVCGAAAVVILHRYGVDPAFLNPQFVKPHGWLEWFVNVTLLPIPVGGMFVPVAGALAVEIGVYILIPLMAFNRPAAWLGLILSLLLSAQYGFHSDTFGIRYSYFLTCFAVFAFGSLVSHHRETLEKFKAPVLSVLVWLIHSLIWLWYDPWPWGYGIYFSILLSAWVVISFASQKTGKLDRILGDLSYPIYLFHTVVGAWVLLFVHQGRSFLFFCISFVMTLLLSWAVVVGVDSRIGQFKKQRQER